jgi:hypothetical protein
MKIKLFKEIMTLEPIWKNIPTGSKFKGQINNISVSGRIYKNKNERIFLCQNHIEGNHQHPKLGYKYSWTISDGSLYEMQLQNVKITDIQLDPNYKILEDLYVGPHLVNFLDKHLIVGCEEVSYELVKEIYDRAVKLKYISK